MSEPRPDPDELLRRLQAEEGKSARAKLKLFFGFAPGVGKTYRMLQVARDRKLQGTDVVVGVVETHARVETAGLVAALEVLPRKRLDYRGHVLEEFDLEAALARKPDLLLVDELAHSNAPGSRHGKRWQDVLDLLDAGIDVYTTVNVQHVASLNDVIAQITGVQVRETVPDALLERADEIELIDISPEQLLQRLHEGKVYLPEQAQLAGSHFFQRGNLIALRELALRQTALQVESDVQEYREAHGVDATWNTSERVLVSVGPAPGSARLLRAAKRMAVGLRAPWVAAYVEATGRPPLRAADRERLESHLRLAESLGASVVRLSGLNVAGPLLAYAQKQNVTRIVIGKPTHARLLDRLRGSLLDDVVRASGDIDVHVISGDEPSGSEATARDPGAAHTHNPAAYGLAALLVTATTGLAAAIRGLYPVPDLEMLYLLAIMIAALTLGRGPSIAAAAMSVAAYDFFFVPPRLTFAVRDAQYILTFGVMFAVGLALSALAARVKRQEREAVARETRASSLHALSRSLGALLDPEPAADVIARQAAEAFDADVAVLTPDDAGSLRVTGSAPNKTLTLGTTELSVAKWVFEHRRLAGLGTDTLPGSKAVCSELRVGPAVSGVLAVLPRSGRALDADQRSFLEAFCRLAAFAFERGRLSEQARTAALRARTEELRSSLLSAVSHDLRTPLAAITGAGSSLRDNAALSEPARRELLDTVVEEAARLERLVANLLDMTRVETGGLAPKREWVPLEELVGSALTRLEHELAGRDVQTRIDADVPWLSVDPVLMQQVFVNLFENAAKYTPAGSPIEVAAHKREGDVVIEIADRGPGIAPANLERVFEKFFRGQHGGVRGVGLGLPICRGVVEAHGGTLLAENREDGGARFRIRLPAMAGAPDGAG